MSIYKPENRPHYLYDFQVRGHRFHGTTGCTSRRDAEAFEKQRRKEAAREVEANAQRKSEPMTFGRASTRYWEEIGQHTASSEDTEWSIAWLQREIGMGTRLVAIDDNLVAGIVAKRRGEHVMSRTKRRKPKPLRPIAPSTVNRTVTEPLRRIMRRARDVWREPVGPVDWKHHLLREPEERVRELRTDEEETLFAKLRADYHPIVRFAILSGCRLNECVTLQWKDVDWGARKIWVTGKGNKRAAIPMPPTVRELLWPLQGQHPEAVFTYVAARATKGRRAGRRYPITYEGLKTAFRRDVKTELDGYRFHDNRHTAATRVLRTSGNLKIVQKMLRHTDISTTTKYAHVMHDDVLEAMEKAAQTAAVTQTTDKSTDDGVAGLVKVQAKQGDAPY